MAEEKKLNLEETIKQMNKKTPGSVMQGDSLIVSEDGIDFGSLGLNLALGLPNGVPKGKIIEVYGEYSSGKSTLAQTLIGNAQKQYGMKCLYLDFENSLSPEYLKSLNVNIEDLYILQLGEGGAEQMYDTMQTLVETGEIDVVCVDSTTASHPSKVVYEGLTESTLGLHAKFLGRVIVKMNMLAKQYNTLFILIAQQRQAVGVIYGSPTVIPGGMAARYFAHIRLEVSRSVSKDNTIMDGDIKLGNKTTVKVIKNKLGCPFKQCSFNIIYGHGIDREQEIIDIAGDYLDEDVYKKYGNSVTYMGTKQKIEDFKQLLTDTPELYEELKQKILKTVNL